MGVYLGELNLVLGDGLTGAVEDDEASAGGALIYGADEELFHLGLVELLHVVVVYGRIFEVVTLGLGHRLRLWALGRHVLEFHGSAVGRGWFCGRGRSPVTVQAKVPGSEQACGRRCGGGERVPWCWRRGLGRRTTEAWRRTTRRYRCDLWTRLEATAGHATETG